MRELSLFTGAGGGILGSVLLGHRIVGAVEIDEYCCRVLERRQRDGVLEPFPIFQTDIRDFVREGYASLYKGRCDLISAGFPCQPFSVAGNQDGERDARNMWPATIECIRIIRPKYALLENVSGLVTSGYFGTILGDLVESGYDCRWRILSAAELGAPHKRDRLWIVAHAASQRQQDIERSRQVGSFDWFASIGACRDEAVNGERRHCNPWHETKPGMGRVVDGLAYGMDRLTAAGNGQVPIVVRTAWELLI